MLAPLNETLVLAAQVPLPVSCRVPVETDKALEACMLKTVAMVVVAALVLVMDVPAPVIVSDPGPEIVPLLEMSKFAPLRCVQTALPENVISPLLQVTNEFESTDLPTVTEPPMLSEAEKMIEPAGVSQAPPFQVKAPLTITNPLPEMRPPDCWQAVAMYKVPFTITVPPMEHADPAVTVNEEDNTVKLPDACVRPPVA